MGTSHFGNISSNGTPLYGSRIPPIIGQYYHVCPNNSWIVNAQGQQIVSSDGNDGLTPQTPLATFLSAYNRCAAGDGIIVWHYGNDVNSQFRFSSQLTFTKNNITVIGMAPILLRGRESIVLTNDPNTAPNLRVILRITGNDNVFSNFRIRNDGTQVGTVLGAVEVTGSCNQFNNIQFDTPTMGNVLQAAGTFGLYLNGASNNTFEDCIFGGRSTDAVGSTYIVAPVTFDNNCGRNSFIRPMITSCYSAEIVVAGAIKIAGVNSLTEIQEFRDAVIIVIKSIDGRPVVNSVPNVVVYGAVPGATAGGFILLTGSPAIIGYHFLSDDVGTNDFVWVSAGVADASGGIAVLGS